MSQISLIKVLVHNSQGRKSDLGRSGWACCTPGQLDSLSFIIALLKWVGHCICSVP